MLLSDNDDIHNEAHYVASNNTFFWKMLKLFIALIKIMPPS